VQNRVLKGLYTFFFEFWLKKAKKPTPTLHSLHICIYDSLSESARDAVEKISKITIFVISTLHACLIGSVTGHALRNDESEEEIGLE